MQSIFTLEMLQHGVLGFKQFRPSYAHDEPELLLYRDAVDEVFKYISSLKESDFEKANLTDLTFKKLTKE